MRNTDQSVSHLRLVRNRPYRGVSTLRIEIEQMIVDLASEFARPHSSLYELGCAHGSVLPALHKRVARDVKFITVDDSEEMPRRCHGLLAQAARERRIEFHVADFSNPVALHDASVIVMQSTLHAMRPLKRRAFLTGIHQGLRDGGCALIVEPVLVDSSLLNNIFAGHCVARLQSKPADQRQTDIFRSSVDDLLIPYRLREVHELLACCGFRFTEIFLKWYGVCGIIAIK